MERVIQARRPAPSKSEGLSTTARVFFGLNIFQVIAIGGIQGAMIVFGNFKPVSELGLGPGRRIYMALFLGAVLYSCFLCLFAVKKQNFLEILAFVLQNYAYIIYSGIQVYHISFKKYDDHAIERQPVLVYLTIIDSIGLLVLNVIFTCLAAKLFGEYGWKIYKRVRFNIKLRAAFHLYETVVMLLKMLFLFITMFAICLNQTLLYDQVDSFSYIASLASIPVCLIFTIIGIISIRKEKKYIAYFFILGVLSAITYFIFKMASVASAECTVCIKKESVVRDIPGEVNLHLLYLGSVNLVLLLGLFIAFIKAVRNFGIGLAAHFENDTNSKFTALSLSNNILTSIVTSSCEEHGMHIDFDTPRPSVSNEPRPSVFQYLPKFIGTANNSFEDTDHGRSLSLPVHLQKRDNIAKQIGRSAKSRISQMFWESDFGRFSSHSNSVSSRHYSSCFGDCCPSLRGRRTSFSAYIVPEMKFTNVDNDRGRRHRGLSNNGSICSKHELRTRQRKRSRSVGDPSSIHRFSLTRITRVNSLPSGDTIHCRSLDYNSTPIKRPSGSGSASKLNLPIIITGAPCDMESTDKNFNVNPMKISTVEKRDSYRTIEVNHCLSKPSVRPILPRRVRSSTPCLSSVRTDIQGIERGSEEVECNSNTCEKGFVQQLRTEGAAETATKATDKMRRALSDYDILKSLDKKVHFA